MTDIPVNQLKATSLDLSNKLSTTYVLYSLLTCAGCKEGHFHSLPSGQAEASIY